MREPAKTDNRTFLDIIGTLYRRKWVIVATTLRGSIGVFLFALMSIVLPPEKSYLPNYFIPEAHNIISDSDGGGLTDLIKSAGLGSLAGLAGIGTEGPTASGLAIKIATTNSVLDQLASDFDFIGRYQLHRSHYPKTVARKLIKQNLRIDYDTDSGVITLGYRSIEKELATQIVNRAVEILEERFSTIAIDRNRTQLGLIVKKLKDVEAEMIRLQDRLNAFQGQYNTFDIAALAKEQAAKLGALRTELLQKSLEIDSYSKVVGIEDPALQRLRVERDTLKGNIARLEKEYQQNGTVGELPALVLQSISTAGSGQRLKERPNGWESI